MYRFRRRVYRLKSALCPPQCNARTACSCAWTSCCSRRSGGRRLATPVTAMLAYRCDSIQCESRRGCVWPAVVVRSVRVVWLERGRGGRRGLGWSEARRARTTLSVSAENRDRSSVSRDTDRGWPKHRRYSADRPLVSCRGREDSKTTTQRLPYEVATKSAKNHGIAQSYGAEPASLFADTDEAPAVTARTREHTGSVGGTTCMPLVRRRSTQG